MAKEVTWYEVIDLTSWVIKYPKDWYARNGRNYYLKEAPVFEHLGCYSSKKKAIERLKRWALEKGIDYYENNHEFSTKEPLSYYYENDFAITCTQICEIGIWFDLHDNPAKDSWDRVYGTGAAIIKKTLKTDED